MANNPATDVKNLPENLVKGYYEAFKLGDPEGSNKINSEEYFKKLEELGIEVPVAAEFDDLQYGTDVDNEIGFTFPDFVSTLASAKTDNPDEMAAIFEVFDRDGNKEISKENLDQILDLFGLQITDEEWNAVIKESDKNKDGTLNLQEFLDCIKYGEGYVRKNGIPPGC